MASMGVPEQEMCRAVRNPRTSEPISSTTLRKIFRGELDKGFVQADAQVAASLFKNATTGTDAYPGGNPVCQIFWLKCRNRWQQDPAKNPPPLAEISEEIVDMVDFGRRLAFTLAAAAAAADGPEEEPA
jgi:hypothetical protein